MTDLAINFAFHIVTWFYLWAFWMHMDKEFRKIKDHLGIKDK